MVDMKERIVHYITQFGGAGRIDVPSNTVTCSVAAFENLVKIIDAQQKLLIKYRLGGGRPPLGALDFLQKAVRP